MAPLKPDDPAAIGPYRLLGRLGEGGQGVVYLGEAPDGQRVAVKVLLDGYAGDHRFAKEVEAARQVEPFCIAQVLDASLGGRPYIVTEYVEGPPLSQAGRHTGADLQRLAVATATALAAIHRAGVVHRDFKPANVLLGRDGPRVIDFGIARAMGHSLTVTSSIVGTPSYMAPEQLAGEPVGPATDVFAWAGVMVFAATGGPPFGNDSLPAVIRRILHDEPYLGEVPPPLRPILLACLAKNPAARPSMQEVLLWLLGSRPAPPMPPQAASPSGPPTAAPRRRGNRTAVLIGAGAVVVTGALAAGVITLLPPGKSGVAAPPVQTPAPERAEEREPQATTTGQPRTITSPSKRSTPPRTNRPAPMKTTQKPTQQPTTAAPKTSAPRTTKKPSGGTVSLVSLTLDGMKMGDCYHPSTFAVATLTGPKGRQIEYGYRWVVDGQDEGRLSGFITNGQDVLRRNPLSSFPAGRHTVVFSLLTHNKRTMSKPFTICEI
ncbi:protein kinase [Nonomuraea sp. NPDC004580]|uniref:serine/threonine protein kinase n=1 Tax=Nonomuraea sp. NPDC004580 TaxID=3154552 RepID=UPI0033BB79C7